mmetsp:Transcript_69063/g.223990  ORF Transcript_69063/g.223990 Transcript_69063/m.223990 type:complete len:256 (-) Transcript_69063:149-916(-)
MRDGLKVQRVRVPVEARPLHEIGSTSPTTCGKHPRGKLPHRSAVAFLDITAIEALAVGVFGIHGELLHSVDHGSRREQSRHTHRAKLVDGEFAVPNGREEDHSAVLRDLGVGDANGIIFDEADVAAAFAPQGQHLLQPQVPQLSPQRAREALRRPLPRKEHRVSTSRGVPRLDVRHLEETQLARLCKARPCRVEGRALLLVEVVHHSVVNTLGIFLHEYSTRGGGAGGAGGGGPSGGGGLGEERAPAARATPPPS